jgi:alpha-beta hydrolase superfamily lysophospholipase
LAALETNWVTKDGLKIFAREWRPEKTPVAAVSLVHGLGEHSGRYEHVARMFNQAGITLMAFDLRGHGRSEGIRGHFPSYDIVMDDITQLLEQTRQNNPGVPLFLYGHSLGGSLVLNFGLTRTYPLSGIIATSPGLAAGTPVSPLTMTAGKLLYSLLPTMTLPNGLDLNGLSQDPEVKKVYLADPLVHSKISARLGMDLLNKGPWIIAHASEFRYPLLLLQGGADVIANPRTNRELAEKMGNKVTFQWFEGKYHELHNEPGKEEMVAGIITWMKTR